MMWEDLPPTHFEFVIKVLPRLDSSPVFSGRQSCILLARQYESEYNNFHVCNQFNLELVALKSCFILLSQQICMLSWICYVCDFNLRMFLMRFGVFYSIIGVNHVCCMFSGVLDVNCASSTDNGSVLPGSWLR